MAGPVGTSWVSDPIMWTRLLGDCRLDLDVCCPPARNRVPRRPGPSMRRARLPSRPRQRAVAATTVHRAGRSAARSLEIASRSSNAAHDSRAESTAASAACRRSGVDRRLRRRTRRIPGRALEFAVVISMTSCRRPRWFCGCPSRRGGSAGSPCVGEESGRRSGPARIGEDLHPAARPATRSTAGGPALIRLSNRSQLRCRSPSRAVIAAHSRGRGDQYRLVGGERRPFDRALTSACGTCR